MAKYIERDCLIDMIDERNRNTCNGKMSCIQMKRMVESIPAADVSPVRHGRFVHDGPRFAGGVDWWRCSSCGGLVSGAETRFDYCPNCGCKMDLEE